MMRRTALRVLLGASALVALWTPVSASGFSLPLPAGTSPEVRALVDSQVETGAADPRHKEISHQFVLHGSHHYSVSVFADGNSVLIEVGRRHDHSITAYAVKGKVTGHLIRADFGALGFVSMHFRPSSRRGSVERRDFCHGVPHTIDRHGIYTGKIRIRGEDGYVSVASHRAKGKLETSTSSPCDDIESLFRSDGATNSSHHHGKQVKRPRLFFASWREGPHSVIFAALTHRTETHFVTLAGESLGRMGIFHFASITAPPRVFALDDAITRAKLSGRKPFQGEGIYTAAPDGSTTWEGSLSADFPGSPDFPLTGPQFKIEVDAGF